MSDAPQGEGWWIASDGKWYPPEAAQTPAQADQQPPTQPLPTEQVPPVQPPPAPGQASGQQPPPAPGQAPGTPPPFTGGPGAGGAAVAGGIAAAGGAPGIPGGPPPEGADESKGGKGKWIALVIVLLLIAAGVAAFFFLGGDDDGSADTADTTVPEADIGDATGDVVDDGPIEFDKQYTTTLEGERTEARYTLEAPAGAIMTLEVSNDRASKAAVRAIYSTVEDRFVDLRVNPGAGDSGQVILGADGASQFELAFTGGPAKFTFEVGLQIQDDAGQGGDAGAELPGAFEVSAGQAVSGMLGGADATDYYTVPVEPGSKLTFSAAAPGENEGEVRFIVSFDGDRLFDERIQAGSDFEGSLLLADTDEGRLEVAVSGGPGDYEFTAGFAETNDGGKPGDASAELADAREVNTSSPVEGTVSDRDEGDYYLFAAPGATFNVAAKSATTSEGEYRVIIEDPQGSRVADLRVQPGAQMTEIVKVEVVGEMRMQVTGGRAAYSIKIG